MEDKLQEHGVRVHVDGLELPRLEAAPLVRVKAEVAQPLELDLVERDLARKGLWPARQKGEKLNLRGNLALMRQELELLELH